MTDFPDTTGTHHESKISDSEEEHDDAEGYYVLGEPVADTKAPAGPIDERWQTRKFEARLVNPANRRKLDIIIVGTG
ncbi:MAG TPA: fumarate reductase/succinate dehydrogenase flavoprotein subunit, partial [Aeromicrobium sp.]|nr:fumarate reductase/succinate dehydrogenase flavoprotein subunit [Aeromicrobium sp.]